MTLTADQLLEISAIATQHVNDAMPDIAAQANYLFNSMMKRKKYVSGGKKIQLPIFGFAELASQGFIAGNATSIISLNPNQVMTYGELNWKYFYHTVPITLEDITVTEDAPEAIISMSEAKVKYAKGSVARTLTAAIHGTAVTDPNAFNGFLDIFAASGTAYAGVLDTDVSGWLTEINSSIQAVNYTNISPMIDKLKARCQQQPLEMDGSAYKPELMLSNDNTFTAFKAAEQLKQRFQNSTTVAAGFTGVEVDGLLWMIDSFTPGSGTGTADNYLYVLTPQSFDLFYKFGLGKASPLDQKAMIVPNQPIQASVNYLTGNVGCTNRRVNGVFKTLKP